MKEFVKNFLIGIALTASGIAMIETPFSGSETYSIAAMIFMPIFGVILLFGGFIFLAPAISTAKSKFFKAKNTLESYIADSENEPKDVFSTFRADYAAFLLSNSAEENPKVQNDVTQMFRNILELHRRRLRRLNVSCRFKSVRKSHSINLPPVVSDKYSDGKYMIDEVKEDIAASTEYLKDGRIIYARTDNDIAHYTLASAKHITENEIVCPNCGATQTKEQLLDGCDYCGTKFMVEDLSEKISDFALRSDYELQYSRYKDVRKYFTPFVGFGVEAVVCFFYILYLIFNFSKLQQETGAGFLTMLGTGILTSVIAAIPFAFIAIGLFNTFVFPLIQLGASFSYVSKKILDKQKTAEKNNRQMQIFVKRTDPHFSIASFYSNVQNKLATVHFAETDEQINAFAVCDLSALKDGYKNVIDMQTEYISLNDYSVSNGLQKAYLEASVKLISFDGEKCTARNEHIRMLLTKSADCKTQVVCGPSVMTCKGCGTSLSLLEGKKCAYCGRDMDLEKHDWVIRDYQVLG